MSDDPVCDKCGHPRSNHPYRHPFVGPSRDDTIAQQADRIEELEAKLSKAVARAEVADETLDKAIDASRALIAKMRDRTDDQWRPG